MFNLTYHRHVAETGNLSNAITRENRGGGTMLNCILILIIVSGAGDMIMQYNL